MKKKDGELELAEYEKILQNPDRGSDFTDEEREFANFFQEAMKDEIADKPYPSFELDRSFLNEEPEWAKPKRAKFKPQRVAVVLVFFLVAVLGTSIWLSSESAVAVKFEVKRVLNSFENGAFVENQEGKEETDRPEELSYEITDMKDIDQAIAFAPGLCVPEYVPEGYRLHSLKIEKTVRDRFFAIYELRSKSKNVVTINVQSGSTEALMASVVDGESIKLPDREYAIWEDGVTGTHGVNVLLDGLVIVINGDSTINEMIAIVESLEIQ